MTLPTRMLGTRTVTAVGLGCMNLSHAYGRPPSEQEARRVLDRALDLGCTHFDTAALYGGGANERLVGQALAGRREHVTLASKCVLDIRDGERVLDGRPDAIARTLDAALGRLGTDHIDLYYLHRLDKTVPIEDSVGALVRAMEAGKIGGIGLSEMGAATIRRAHAVHPVTALQTEYSPISRNAEAGVLDVCRELGISFVAFSPVARGLLAGAIRDDHYAEGDIRRGLPRYVEPRLAHNLRLVRQFDHLASEAGLHPAQLAIGWGLGRDAGLLSIPGTTRIEHLEQNLASAPLPPDLVAAVDALFPPNAAAGARYSKVMQAQIDTELLPGEQLAD